MTAVEQAAVRFFNHGWGLPYQMKMSMKPGTHVLVYQIGSLGDTVITIPALNAVRRHCGPSARIALLHEIRPNLITTPQAVLEGMGLVDEYLKYRVADRFLEKYQNAVTLALRLRTHRFDSVVYLAPSQRPRSIVKRDALFFRASGIRDQIGFCDFTPELLGPTSGEGLAFARHEAWFRLERLRRDGFDVSLESDLTRPFLSLPLPYVQQARQWLNTHRKRPKWPLVAICPGCKQPTNVWPVERFIELGQRLVQQGDLELLIVGGPNEREIGERMITAWGSGLNAAGAFSPLGSAALLAETAFMVGLDTGTTHLAAAQGVPCVALYGSREPPGRFFPLGTGHIVLRNSVPCEGCDIIMQPCLVGGHPCMNGHTVDAVWQAVQSMQSSLSRATKSIYF